MGKSSAGRFSVLESLRGLAAIYVLMGHFVNLTLHNPSWGFIFRFSQEAVILFFLLSGFVIYYSTFSRSSDLNLKDYFIKRVRRIYPLFIISLFFSYLLACWGAGSWIPFEIPLFLGNLFMLQDFDAGKPGVWFATFHNGALWSLSYEWWFYVGFCIVHYCIGKAAAQKYVVTLLGLLCLGLFKVAPNQLCMFGMYFVIWWCGVELAREHCQRGHISWRGQYQMWCLLGISASAWILVLLWGFPRSQYVLGLHPIMECRHIVSALLLLLVGMLWRQCGWIGYRYTLYPFIYLAGISYGIYIFHFPIIVWVNSFWPGHWTIELAIVITLTLTVAFLGEQVLQPVISRWSDRWLTPNPKRSLRQDATDVQSPPLQKQEEVTHCR